MYKGSGKM